MTFHLSLEHDKAPGIGWRVQSCTFFSALQRFYHIMDRPAHLAKDRFSSSSSIFKKSASEASLLDARWQNETRNVGWKMCSSSKTKAPVLLDRPPGNPQGKVRTGEEGNERREHVSVSSTSSLESVHVQRVYDQIAPHIEDLKPRIWPRVKEFLKSLKAGALVADVGCGNGRYLHINPSIFKIGSDICQPFLQTAVARGFEVLLADNLLLPFRDNIFDAAISVGVIHHFASKERRVQALQEMVRILLPGGLVMVYVWAFEQKYRKFDSQDILVPWYKPRQADAGHRHPRSSSLSEVDRVSISSTGSSVSDEEFTLCPCRQNNVKSDVCQPDVVGPCLSCQVSNSPRNQKKDFVSEDCFHKSSQTEKESDLENVKSTRSSCADESSSCMHKFTPSCVDKLSKGEELIKECQKVETYLSSLCKSPWELLPERSKSGNTWSQGSFEEGALTSTTKSSPSWQSLSLQDDDVFVTEKPESPMLDNSASKEFSASKHAEGKLVLMACSFDSQNSSPKEKCTFWKPTKPKDPSGTLFFHHDDKEKSVRLKDDKREKFSSGGDDFDVIDIETEVVPINGIHFDNHRKMNSPLGMLDMLKQGLKNMFTKTKQDNHKKAAACFMPCLATHFPQEQFQIREFPQSSLPCNVVEKSVLCAVDSPSSGQNARSHGTASFEDEAKKNNDSSFFEDDAAKKNGDSSPFFEVDAKKNSNSPVCFEDNAKKANDSKCQTNSQNCFTYHLMKEDFESQKNTAAAPSSNSALAEGKLSSSQSSTFDAEVTGNNASVGKKLPCKGTTRKSRSSKSLKQPPKLDTVNTDLCRFYHVFRKGELEELIRDCVPGVRMVDSFYDHANWCVILEKL
ncbi:uncharacterized protein LOC143284008 [Babylonia areolata]|uniref:uncharacterized protein LOC143284008 n=1 Tax=Babylonia areolata TaxID=304850 RepID=UPI003FCF24EF